MASFKCKGIYLGNSSTISGQNEKINTKFTIKDYFDGEKTTEDTEVKMQKTSRPRRQWRTVESNRHLEQSDE